MASKLEERFVYTQKDWVARYIYGFRGRFGLIYQLSLGTQPDYKSF